MGGYRYIDYATKKSKERLRKTEASLQDFRDIFAKKQVRREDKEGFQRKMDQVGDRRDAERKALEKIQRHGIRDLEG